jgi:hypothetical protein
MGQSHEIFPSFLLSSCLLVLETRVKWKIECVCHLQVHCKEDSIYVFPDIKLRGLVPNFPIYTSVSDLYTVFPG